MSIERAMDALARKLGMDPVELRRKNFITEFPKTMASGLTIDSGDYPRRARPCCSRSSSYEGIRGEQAPTRGRGDAKQLGIGFSTYTEMCGLAPSRILGAIRYGPAAGTPRRSAVQPTGTMQVLIGTSPHGQGHVTTLAQIVADRSASPSTTSRCSTATRPSSRSAWTPRQPRRSRSPASRCARRARRWSARRGRIAAHQLEVAEEDLEDAEGAFTVKGSPDRSMTIQAAAFAAHSAHNLPDGMEPGLEETAVFDPPNFSWPAGAHAAVVEVDTETGDTRLVRYIAVDDVGTTGQPADHRRAGARRRHAGHRGRPLGGRRPTTRRATS